MALINCPQCGKQVSDKAPKCPHCGLDMTVPYAPPKAEIQEETQKKPRKVWNIIAIVVGCLGVVSAVLWFFVFKGMVKTNEMTEQKPVVSKSTAVAEPRTGNEMQQNATTFPYNTYFTGTIGSKGSMTIDEDGGGSYTYDLNGTPLTRNIRLQSYDKSSGHLFIESYDKSGKYIGLFDGYTSNDNSYSGSFTNYKGGTVKFRLEVKAEDSQVPIPLSNRYVVIDGTELRLRLGPSTSADTFKWGDGSNRHPNIGERYRYLGESGDFYKIDYKGHELWVSKQYTYLE